MSFSNSDRQQKQIKVLCVGDVNGKFEQLIHRISFVNKKCGPFDVLLCVGEFFGPNDEENKKILSGELQFPIPAYILGPCCPSTSLYFPDQSIEFSPSLTYLGKKGILTTANGLTIGYFSGIEAAADQKQVNAFQFDQESVDDLLLPVSANSGFIGVDILLTSIWPADVWKYSTNQPTEQPNGSKLISRLASGLRPRYHFAGQGNHYERSPYRNHRVLLEPTQQVTRFIGLAAVDNPAKQKWLYAFSITPLRILSRTELVAQPDNCSEFPYMEILQEFLHKKAADERSKANGNAQFFFDLQANSDEKDLVDRGGRSNTRKRRYDLMTKNDGPNQNRSRIDPNMCWFCLSNANTEKQLIVSVGNQCYTAMPKGPLNERHLLVMSIGHIQSFVAAPSDVRDEVLKFRDAYSLFCNQNDESLCVFERNYKTEHMQMQFVPIPKTKSKALRSTFQNFARLKNIEFSVLNDNEQIWDLLNEGQPYFYLELPDGIRMFTRNMTHFPIQFGREVLASKALLDCEDKVDWRNCALDKEKETELTNKLKDMFKPFDFTDNDSDED